MDREGCRHIFMLVLFLIDNNLGTRCKSGLGGSAAGLRGVRGAAWVATPATLALARGPGRAGYVATVPWRSNRAACGGVRGLDVGLQTGRRVCIMSCGKSFKIICQVFWCVENLLMKIGCFGGESLGRKLVLMRKN